MKSLEKFLLESFKLKGSHHYLENNTKIKQYIDNVLATTAGQTLEESSKTMYTALISVRDIMINEISNAYFASSLDEKVKQYHELVEEEQRKKEVEESDLQLLKDQDQKKSLDQD